jgi:hypothetical protein
VEDRKRKAIANGAQYIPVFEERQEKIARSLAEHPKHSPFSLKSQPLGLQFYLFEFEFLLLKF